MLIYKITSPSGKYYIGKTSKTVEYRFNQHVSSAINSKANLTPFYKAIMKYGKESFIVEVIETCTKENINERERFWISELKALSHENGYNVTRGGEGVDSETARTLKQAWWDSDKSDERRAELSTIMTENNPGKAMIGKPSWNAGLTDYLSDESRAKMSTSQIASWDDERRSNKSVSSKKAWADGKFDNRPAPTQEAIDKRIATMKENPFTQTDKQKNAAREANIRNWILVFVDGSTKLYTGLQTIMSEYSLSEPTIHTIKKGNRSTLARKNNILAILPEGNVYNYEALLEFHAPKMVKSTQETIDKAAASRRGFKQSNNQKQKAAEANQKSYVITYFDGRVDTIKGLSDYAKQVNISYTTLFYLLTKEKSSPKWKIESVKHQL